MRTLVILRFAAAIATLATTTMSSAQPAPKVEPPATSASSRPPEVRRPWSFGIAPRLAVTVPTSKLKSMVVGGLELDVVTPVADHRLVLAVDVTLTRPSYAGSGSDPRVNGSYSYEVLETEVKIGLDAIFRIARADKAFVPYVGAGPLIHLLRTTETTTFAAENMEQSTKLGFELLVGADYRIGPGMLLGDLRLVYSDLDHLFTGDTNAGNVLLGMGYRLVF